MRDRRLECLVAGRGLVHFSAARLILRINRWPKTWTGPFPVALVALVALMPAPAYAHKLNVFASAEGTTIRGKVYFSGGTPAQDVAVTALSPTGQQIGQTKTDAEGHFAMEARFRCDYRLLAETGDGHGGEYTLTASVLPNDLPPLPAGEKVEGESPHTGEHAFAEPTSTVVASFDQIGLLRAEIVRLEQQLNAYENRVRMTDVLGGIGYIVGLTGAAYYYLGARRKRAGNS
jgi:nickel transport protein